MQVAGSGAASVRMDHGLVERMLDVARRETSDADFRSRTLELPAMLQRSGLAASLVYLVAKDDASRKLANALVEELGSVIGPDAPASAVALAEWTATTEASSVLVAQQHARSAAMWLKRMVEAVRSEAAMNGDGTGEPSPEGWEPSGEADAPGGGA